MYRKVLAYERKMRMSQVSSNAKTESEETTDV